MEWETDRRGALLNAVA